MDHNFVERCHTIVIGAGHAGLVTSYHLARRGIPHLVLERGRVGERWRSERWESMNMITPNFMLELPGLPLDADPDGYLSVAEFIDYLDRYKAAIDAPVRTAVNVSRLASHEDDGFQVETSAGTFLAQNVVVATGFFQAPHIPDFADRLSRRVLQLHSSRYMSPRDLPSGAVLVVGCGNSGVQIAAEVQSSGRQTFFSVGRHSRGVRFYRGRSGVRWSQMMGTQELTVDAAPAEALRYGAQITQNVRMLALQGIRLLGRVEAADGESLTLSSGLAETLNAADAAEQAARERIDQFIAEHGIDAPVDDALPLGSIDLGPEVHALDLAENDISTVIWATGYGSDYAWIEPNCFDEAGSPLHQRGVTAIPGLYFIGLRWLHKAKSFIIYGVDEDAGYLAEYIATHAIPEVGSGFARSE